MRIALGVGWFVCTLAMFGCGDDDAGDAGDSSVDMDAEFRDAAGDAAIADAAPSDSSTVTSDADPDAPVVDAGPSRVPMFVAVGWGGRRIMSCDLGRTWVGDQFESTEDDWHQPYSPKGLAYSNGRFVFLSGWGNPSTTWVSEDGLSWDSQSFEITYTGIGVDADGFVAVGGRGAMSSPDGSTWTPIEGYERPGGPGRDGNVFGEMWLVGGDGEVVHRRPGGAWLALESCMGARHGSIGVRGGFAAGLGRAVSFGDEGFSCAVDIETGEDLGSGAMGTDQVRGYGAFVGDEFWVPNDRTLLVSADGLAWEERALPDGVRFELVARSAEGTYVGVARNGDNFFYSDDGETWERAEAPEGNNLFRVVAGYGSPSAMCPE